MSASGESSRLYAGLSGVRLPQESFDFGNGVVARNTYAHLMAPFMVAFARPSSPARHHPGPWESASGGFGYDIEVELCVPETVLIGPKFTAKDTVWWIAALLRMAEVPSLTVPVISSHPFGVAKDGTVSAKITPFEVTGRIVSSPDGEPLEITLAKLRWVKDTWTKASSLLASHPQFYNSIKAFDAAMLPAITSASLLTLWGGLEQLFAPAQGELRFRVSALIASFLEPPGPKRLSLFKDVMKLYNARSLAAHTAKGADREALVKSFVLMRNVLVRMIDNNSVPSQGELEKLLFSAGGQ